MKKSVLSVMSILLATILLTGCAAQPAVSSDTPDTPTSTTTTVIVTAKPTSTTSTTTNTTKAKATTSTKKKTTAPKKKTTTKKAANPTTAADSTTTKTTKATKTITQATANTQIVLADFLGKTVGDVRKAYGNGFSFSGYSGSSIMNYSDNGITFFLDGYYENPTDKHTISIVLSWSDEKVLDSMDGTMTYKELVTSLGPKISLEEPEYWYNAMDDVWQYTLSFNYSGYAISFTWLDDPDTTLSHDVMVQKIVPATKPTTTTTTHQTTKTRITPSTETQQLMYEIADFLINGYFSTRDIQIIDIEIYTESDELLACTVVTTNEYADYGFDFYKETRQIEFYNRGNFVFSDTVP